MTHSPAWPLRIYYDRSCPLCPQEMHALVAHDHAGRIELVDCSRAGVDPAAEEGGGASSAPRATVAAGEAPDAGKPTRAALMAIIHARDADGRWYRGVEVFVLAYAAVGLDGMARLWSHPWLRRFWDRAYPWFARNRQWLSRLGTARAYGWLLDRAAARAARRSAACVDGACRRP